RIALTPFMSSHKPPLDPTSAATTIQSAYRAHKAHKTLSSLSTMSPDAWSDALTSCRLALVHERDHTATSNNIRAAWRRAELLTSLLGKGSASLGSAPSLTLLTEHWLELTDKEHRYGSNLKPYHETWLASNTSQPFFYWLDHGEGKDVDLPERPRERLAAQKVKYLSAYDRRMYRVTVKDGLLVYALSGEPVHTLAPDAEVGGEELPDADPNDTEEERLRKKKLRNKRKFIYVTDTGGNLYVGQKVKGGFHHSSFLNGGAVLAAGGLVVNRGKLIKINPKSGHYRPESGHFERLLGRLKKDGVDFDGVIVSNPFQCGEAAAGIQYQNPEEDDKGSEKGE
ncbi:hypothetical protein HK104_000103, partial [Borealophlyctis nickersoniae]